MSKRYHSRIVAAFLIASVVLPSSFALAAQDPPTSPKEILFQPVVKNATGQPVDINQPFTLAAVIQTALVNYPSIRAAMEKANAAGEGVHLAKTAYLPEVTFFSQVGRLTSNKTQGGFFSQYGLVSVAGPQRDNLSWRMNWYTAVGTYVDWEPFDFGLRRANVNIARTEVRHAVSNIELTKFDVAARAGNEYLKLLASLKLVLAAQANVDRTKVLEIFVRQMVLAGLRPGADLSKAEADLASAQTGLTQAKEEVELNRSDLAQAIGLPGKDIKINAESFVKSPENMSIPELPIETHPLLVNETNLIQTIRAREVALQKSGLPRFNLVGALNSRQSGLRADGSIMGGANGLFPGRYNAMFGFLIDFTPTQLIAIHDKEKIAVANEHAEQARYEEMADEVLGRRARSSTRLQAAIQIAQETPIQLEAARAAELQYSSRYKAGLSTIVDVADAQRMLTQAEINDAIAKLSIWSALLEESVAQGDLKPFLALMSNQQKGTP